MYNGQIFALLGHNGAGKTTTISMLTGLIEANEGVAEVFGTDIFANMGEVRKFLGVCPQHDVLFDYLTPEEHLRLFAAFKGTDPGIIEA
jgi:ATP-binding cassette subfamily A (ABC1) protein 3